MLLRPIRRRGPAVRLEPILQRGHECVRVIGRLIHSEEENGLAAPGRGVGGVALSRIGEGQPGTSSPGVAALTQPMYGVITVVW